MPSHDGSSQHKPERLLLSRFYFLDIRPDLGRRYPAVGALFARRYPLRPYSPDTTSPIPHSRQNSSSFLSPPICQCVLSTPMRAFASDCSGAMQLRLCVDADLISHFRGPGRLWRQRWIRQDYRRLDLTLRYRPIGFEQCGFLACGNQFKTVPLVEGDRPRGGRPGAHEHLSGTY